MIKIYSWNVNGLRAVIRKDALKPFLSGEQPDILCLQELKAKHEQVDLHLPDYEQLWYSADKPGYSGTAIFTKLKPKQVVNGFPRDIIDKFNVTGDVYGDPNLEGRIQAAEYEKFWIVNVYTPNSKRELTRLELRYKHWDPAFLEYLNRLRNSKSVIFCGDLNVAHTEDDLANPDTNHHTHGFTDEERAGFQNFIDAGYIDTFRLFTKGNGHYTWWTPWANARTRNLGWRIDYIIASADLKPKIKSAVIHSKIMGSDHCPISLVIDL